ncbi:non-hydrolyzing UDP-N-acetylglucosamine 2-epimerase [Actinospica robiniae]|uniref:non-hydrolyzing UDP-N-acetylglucosamine 2-epimerase n=1 Tax=Actinospica robiniae TaxID=304901 RepID=UPI0003F8CA71|nr:UDP-N-acetylglucosamine 2-epimerase (non-hydrolyzing) [Actinospica robiniae]
MYDPCASILNGSVAFVLGTRREIVKLAPLTGLFADAARVIHTGQHYDARLDEVFFTDCGMRRPDVTLGVGGMSRAGQVAAAVANLDTLFAAARPAAVVVQGDTNSALAGALAANAYGIPLVHVEAGLRSHDRRMPEENNRTLIDHVSDLLCAPTRGNVENLVAERLDPQLVELTGNTVVEALRQSLPGPEARAKVLAEVGVQAGRYVLATIHRPENTDDPRVLGAIVAELEAIGAAGRPVLFPVHPRTRAALTRVTGGRLAEGLSACDPLGYREFLALVAECALVVSDSGGIQEETTVLGRPLVLVRRSTERPEALADFACLAEPGPAISLAAFTLLADVESVHARLSVLPSPFGDGRASFRIRDAMFRRVPGLGAR